MRERGMIFNDEMVRAVLEGRKTQTRRVVKFPLRDKDFGCELSGNELAGEVSAGNYLNCPFGAVGDRLWVRENFFEHGRWEGGGYDPEDSYFVSDKQVLYPADGVQRPAQRKREDFWRSRPSIHMPRWASRITLEITGVRVERLKSISEADALAEGIDAEKLYELQDKYDCIADHNFTGRPTAVRSFSYLWRSIYGEESWQANPFVWVIEFKRVEGL